MTWDSSVKVTDLAIILATFCGPIFALMVQRKIDESRALRQARERIFGTLMGTRALTIAPARIEALNSIPIAFYGDNPKLNAVNDAWRLLLAHFDHASAAEWRGDERQKEWEVERKRLDTALLRSIGDSLGYEFPAPDVEKLHYFPVRLGGQLIEEADIRSGLARLLTGKSVLPVAPIVTDDIVQQDKAFKRAVVDLLSRGESLNVRLDTSGQTRRKIAARRYAKQAAKR